MLSNLLALMEERIIVRVHSTVIWHRWKIAVTDVFCSDFQGMEISPLSLVLQSRFLLIWHRWNFFF